jgi:hypothetical protein
MRAVFDFSTRFALSCNLGNGVNAKFTTPLYSYKRVRSASDSHDSGKAGQLGSCVIEIEKRGNQYIRAGHSLKQANSVKRVHSLRVIGP